MLKPTDLNLRRKEIRPGRWEQWPAIGVVGFVGFVVLALLLVFGTVISQLDQQLLAAVISLRTPELTAFASAVTRLGSTPMVAYLGLAAAVVLWLRSRSIVLPIALLAALAATESLVTILKIALDRPRPPAGLVVGVPLSDDAFPSGHTTDGSTLVVLTAAMLALTCGNAIVRWLLMISGCALALLIGCSRTYLGLHWPSDVLGGWLLAATMVSVTMALAIRVLVPYPEGGGVPDALDPDATQLTVPPAGRAEE
jgi:membrane-associated phospholipid phosphatase